MLPLERLQCCVLLHFLSSCGKPSGGQFPSTKQWGSICTWGWAALISPTGPCSGLDQEPKNWDLFSAACPSNIKLYTYLRAIYVISDINELTTANRASNYSCRHITTPFPNITLEHALYIVMFFRSSSFTQARSLSSKSM